MCAHYSYYSYYFYYKQDSHMLLSLLLGATLLLDSI